MLIDVACRHIFVQYNFVYIGMLPLPVTIVNEGLWGAFQATAIQRQVTLCTQGAQTGLRRQGPSRVVPLQQKILGYGMGPVGPCFN